MAEDFWNGGQDPFTHLTGRERDNADRTSVPSPKIGAPTHIVDARERPELFPARSVPPGVFIVGDPAVLERPLVGIVGTRSASPYGRDVASAFARGLARTGATVVSGGAIGIDAAVHTAVLDDGAPTVAVLPCGADVDYPARHRDLFARIRANGCTVSRFPLGATLLEHWLPWRNRTVAAMCQALIVVEAPERSGSLMTAGFARELGRPVFVVPGPVTGNGFQGSHALIREGATLVDEPGQVAAALGMRSQIRSAPDTDRGGVGDRVLQAVTGLPRSAESIGEETGLPVPDVLHALTLLEIDGEVYRSVEGYARRA